MPTGTPHTLKCRKCQKGMWNGWEFNGEAHVVKTGETENRVTTSRHAGHGSGGHAFTGYRGKVRCLDCGHEWFSTHPWSGRMYQCRCYRDNGYETPHHKCVRCKGTGKVPTFELSWRELSAEEMEAIAFV